MGENSTDLEFSQYIRQASIPQQDRARHPCTGTNSQHQGSKQQQVAANRRKCLMGTMAVMRGPAPTRMRTLEAATPVCVAMTHRPRAAPASLWMVLEGGGGGGGE